ncbi:M48 family metalloprotease [Saccharomonospora xinjiangensis]|uniref:Peptidase M48 domain-containing protein n=1 Tax=Saccharomonospora xinjiangensis XJ-54 TaxID=882086 RepID=I0UWS2_9PSEU|nr:M48 family metalloprotease [Saccharomonospora xinjiangensis]EID52325.1 hypothetical protein SacxiDRAFT_0036 [Saccharomonospora xinjiangensis XJ-54]
MTSLREQYRALLTQRGLRSGLGTPEELLRRIERMAPEERQLFAGLAASIRDGTLAFPDEGLFDGLSAELLAVVERSGLPLPTPVFVGEYPHNSFNAQACAVSGGTLILVNTGLAALVHEVAKCWALSLVPFTRDDDRRVRFEEPTAELTRRRDEARSTIANAVIAYVFLGDSRLGGRITQDTTAAMGFALTRATERFVISHELGHLLAGHLDASQTNAEHGELIRKTRPQEFEADEIGALLVLRGLDPGDQVQVNLALAGPFVFFAIDHLVTRVRNEVNDIPEGLIVTDHPPSDERAAAMRRLFVESAGIGALQLAGATVSWLSAQEDDILAMVDERVR